MHFLDNTKERFDLTVGLTHATVHCTLKPGVIGIDKLAGITTATGIAGAADTAIRAKLTMRCDVLFLHRYEGHPSRPNMYFATSKRISSETCP